MEVTSDELSIDQATGQAIFDGNVLVVQGDIRMSAGNGLRIRRLAEKGHGPGAQKDDR